MEAAEQTGWKKCSACKKPIGFEAIYYVCNVSTCNRKRTALQFCDVSCWEVHLPVARHRESWAEERRAPSKAEAARQAAAEASGEGAVRKPRRIIAEKPRAASSAASTGASASAKEVLIVASRLKEYIRVSSGYKMSDRVLEPLSEIVREIAEQAIKNARADGRMTVLDRDIPNSWR
jgi:histone H3/H4